jgi:hypothetical protein
MMWLLVTRSSIHVVPHAADLLAADLWAADLLAADLLGALTLQQAALTTTYSPLAAKYCTVHNKRSTEGVVLLGTTVLHSPDASTASEPGA